MSEFERSCQTIVVVAVELKPLNVSNLTATLLDLDVSTTCPRNQPKHQHAEKDNWYDDYGRHYSNQPQRSKQDVTGHLHFSLAQTLP